ncbi:hypothetical protein KQI88_04370 [Alkaliphilus sp. MSJ-5]|uniref:Uncharacterized protein n=1 Tax=Alkaliphilus flagellatus TaxID=2841507 RepID=A0ABS6G1W2_9FIRM|nr:hypothetical protein [Alkaliphilus flagellatus]MBU5675643.1 hypothetical protein [Alkaliphilus flagellatus]
MRKIKFVLSFCLISILFFLTYNFFQSPKAISVFRMYASPTYTIDKSLIKALHEDDTPMKDDIEKKIIISILDIINYDKWKDFLDYIDIEIYYGNLIPDTSQQLIVSLNLSKDLGVTVIFNEIENKYIFCNKIENLAPIENIKLIKHPTENKDLIVIYQIVDERLGAFFRENFIQIYDYKESSFNLVLEKTLFYEEVFKENWINLEAPDTNWTMVVEETEIDFDYTNSVKINTITSFKKYNAQSKNTPQKNDFLLKEEKSYVRSYYWSDQYNTFILGELTKDVFISNIAILEDMENMREWLFGITNPYYKVSTANRELIYLPKSKFSKLLESTLVD